MNKRDTVVALLASLPGLEWNSLSKQMAWAYRKNESGAPHCFRSRVGIAQMPPREEWELLRKDILSVRRKDEYRRRKTLEQQRADSRRDYMRSYMRSYRRAHA